MELSAKKYALTSALVLLALFFSLTFYIYHHPTTGVDTETTRYLQAQEWASPLLAVNKLFRLASFRLIYVVLIAVFFAARRYDLGLFVVAAPLSELISTGIKWLISRPRPTEEFAFVFDPTNGFSYISGHALEHTLLFGFLGYLAVAKIRNRNYRYILAGTMFILPIIVGFGRVYSGAHWLTDIIGSYLLGGAILITMFHFFKSSFKRPDAVRTG